MGDYFSSLFPTTAGVAGAQATPYYNMMNEPSLMFNWSPGVQSVSPGDLSSMPMPSMDMLGSVATQPAAPGMFDSLKASFSNTPWMSSLDAKTGMKSQGLLDVGLGAAQAGLGAYLGFQNLGIARDTLAQNKRAFDLNFNAQRNLTNSRLQDRQAGRVAFDPNQTSVAAYMKQNGI